MHERIAKAGRWKRKPKPVPPPSAASDLPGTNKMKGLPTLKKLFFDRFMAVASTPKCIAVLWQASLSHNLVLRLAELLTCNLPLECLCHSWSCEPYYLLKMFKLMIRQRNLMPCVRSLIISDPNTKSPSTTHPDICPILARVIPLYSLFSRPTPSIWECLFQGPPEWTQQRTRTMEPWETHIMVRAIRVARRVMPRMNRGRWLTKSYFLSISVLHSQKYEGLLF